MAGLADRLLEEKVWTVALSLYAGTKGLKFQIVSSIFVWVETLYSRFYLAIRESF